MKQRENTLEVTGLSVRFGATLVVHDLSFSVPQGTSLAVVSPNGSGKTVLFRALIGAIPFTGTIEWAPGVRPAEALLLAIATAVAAGLVGSFAVMRRMTLAADALSHVALPGIAMWLHRETGPVIVTIAIAVFVLTLLRRR